MYIVSMCVYNSNGCIYQEVLEKITYCTRCLQGIEIRVVVFPSAACEDGEYEQEALEFHGWGQCYDSKNAFGDFDSKCGKNKYFYNKKVANSEKKTAENSVLNIGPRS
jgi:hypothetical protein